jgi:N-acetylmuramoyl-L-alanine amidase
MENTKTLMGYRVCLEAGHGYHDDNVYDSGANNKGIHEHMLNVAQVEHLAKLLEAKGCSVSKVICTKGNGLSLGQRGLQAAGHHLFISHHHNASQGKKAQGTEVLLHLQGTATDKRFAEGLSKAIANALGYADRGAKKQSLGVLRTVPDSVQVGVLVESYFMDNSSLDPDDLEALSLKAADAEAAYIEAYLLANCKPNKVVMVEPKKVDLPPAEPKKVELPKSPWKR